MITTARLQNAIEKLYAAFTTNKLNPEYCNQCAVGTILDGKTSWKHLSDEHGSLHLNYVGNVHETMGRRFAGYLPSELLQIEAAFLRGCGFQLPLHYKNFKPLNTKDEELLFDGLCEVIGVLCKLDHIPDALDYFSLLENFQDNRPRENKLESPLNK